MAKEWKFENVTTLERKHSLDIYNNLLRIAEKARENASPLTSKFPVGAAIGVIGASDPAFGCNVEYGAGYGGAGTESIHAEEASLADAIRRYGNSIRIKTVAVIGDAPEIVTCCGNCLDVLKTYSNEDTLIIGANTAGKAAIFNFEEIFPTLFEEITMDNLKKITYEWLLVGRAMESRFYNNEIFSKEVIGSTGAAVLTEKGEIYQGVREDRASYHGTSTIDAALAHSRSHGDPFVTAIAYVTDTGYVCGRDRQSIFERADELDRLDDIKVIIYNPEKDILQVATPRELLPYGFGARTLGLENKVRENLNKYRRN